MKIIEKYTPSKGLFLVIVFLCANLGIQLYVITQVGSIEFVGNKIESDLITVCLFVTYALTMISFLFVLSEFFLMRKMESLFTGAEIDTIGKSKKETVIEEIIEHNSLAQKENNPEPSIDTKKDSPKEKEDDDPFSGLFVSDDEEEASTEGDEDPDQGYKVLEIKDLDKKKDDPVETLPKPDFDMDHVSVDSFISKPESESVKEKTKPEPEDEVPEFFDESEILQTLTELKDVVAQLKTKTRGGR